MSSAAPAVAGALSHLLTSRLAVSGSVRCGIGYGPGSVLRGRRYALPSSAYCGPLPQVVAVVGEREPPLSREGEGEEGGRRGRGYTSRCDRSMTGSGWAVSGSVSECGRRGQCGFARHVGARAPGPGLHEPV
jgi:hypothetical protein